MGKDTKISWTDSTWNPWRGCTKVSPGCAHCYAERQSHRNPGVMGIWGERGTRVLASEATRSEPWTWDRAAARTGEPWYVFVASLADIFEDWRGQLHDSKGRLLWFDPRDPKETPLACRDRAGMLPGNPHPDFRPYTLAQARNLMWRTVAACPHLVWLMLTKRPENWSRFWPTVPDPQGGQRWQHFPNLALGISAEDQTHYEARWPHLAEVPVRCRWVSYEPALGPIDFHMNTHPAPDWVVVGGESGPRARPFDLTWAQETVWQCKAAGRPVWVKQMGDHPVNPTGACGDPPLRFRAHHGADPAEWPEALRYQEHPR